MSEDSMPSLVSESASTADTLSAYIHEHAAAVQGLVRSYREVGHRVDAEMPRYTSRQKSLKDLEEDATDDDMAMLQRLHIAVEERFADLHVNFKVMDTIRSALEVHRKDVYESMQTLLELYRTVSVLLYPSAPPQNDPLLMAVGKEFFQQLSSDLRPEVNVNIINTSNVQPYNQLQTECSYNAPGTFGM